MKKKQLTAIALAGVFAAGVLGYGIPAQARSASTDYLLTIPATLTVENAGWNATSGITANNSTNNFDAGMKLTVTAASSNGWALKSGDNSVSYNLAASGDGNSVYKSDATAASWEFSAGELNAESGTTKGMGIIVEDYSNKAAGNYQDTVTFTASVVSATKTLTLTGKYSDYSGGGIVTKSLEIEYTDNDTWKDIAERYDEVSLLDNRLAPEGKAVMFWYDRSQGIYGCELKSNESAYNYNLVSINDKVSAYGSYYLGGN